MNNLDETSESWDALESWLQTEEGRAVSAANLDSQGLRTIISFQASTLDWVATEDFQARLSQSLSAIADEADGSYEIRLSGRSLITAQVTADVAGFSNRFNRYWPGDSGNAGKEYRTQEGYRSRSSTWVCNLDSIDLGRCLGIRNHGNDRISFEF